MGEANYRRNVATITWLYTLKYKDDEWVWKGEETQEYIVKYTYKMLQLTFEGMIRFCIRNSGKQKHYLQTNFLLGDFFRIS